MANKVHPAPRGGSVSTSSSAELSAILGAAESRNTAGAGRSSPTLKFDEFNAGGEGNAAVVLPQLSSSPQLPKLASTHDAPWGHSSVHEGGTSSQPNSGRNSPAEFEMPKKSMSTMSVETKKRWGGGMFSRKKRESAMESFPVGDLSNANSPGLSTSPVDKKRPSRRTHMFFEKLENFGELLAKNALLSPGTEVDEEDKKTWHGKLNKWLHSRTISTFMLVLLLLDMLIVMAGITLEIEYLHSKVTDYKDNLYDCILGEGHYTRDPRVVIAYGPNNLTSTIPTTTSTKWSAHFGNEDLHNAELALINISITILITFIVENLLLLLANGYNFFLHVLQVFDVIICSVSLYFEFNHGNSATSILIFARVWRFMRLGFGAKMMMKTNQVARINMHMKAKRPSWFSATRMTGLLKKTGSGLKKMKSRVSRSSRKSNAARKGTKAAKKSSRSTTSLHCPGVNESKPMSFASAAQLHDDNDFVENVSAPPATIRIESVSSLQPSLSSFPEVDESSNANKQPRSRTGKGKSCDAKVEEMAVSNV